MRYEHRPPGVEKHQEFFVCNEMSGEKSKEESKE